MPKTSTLTHGDNRDCPMVVAGHWSYCKGHQIESVDDRVSFAPELLELARSLQFMLRSNMLNESSQLEIACDDLIIKLSDNELQR